MADKRLYKIIFLNQGKVYELFSEGVTSSGLWGFIEVSDLVFEEGDGLVVDPTEERREGLPVSRFPVEPLFHLISAVRGRASEMGQGGPTSGG